MAFTTINKSTDYFNTKLYTGNGSTQTISGVGHQPDLVWVKQRNGLAYHQLTDAVRGVNSQSASNDVGMGASNACVTAFNSDGFALGSNGDVNGNTLTYASWNWKANGTGSANTDGDINSTVSANTTSGFSIVNYTGTLSGSGNPTVGHGLGVAPAVIIIKSVSNAENWGVQHTSLPANYLLQLNTTSAQINSASQGTLTAPTSSVFTVNYSGEWGNSGQNYIAYCFAEKQGFSKFGSYTGSGSTDGTFIYTGFKPAFVLIKNADFASNWNNFTGKIPGYNQINDTLQPNLSSAENGTFAFDMLSNGFKHRSGDVMDRNGDTHIYMAFAEAPLVGTNNVPATAR